ncbi:MAG TPA: adenylate/guanylate cyclase domain-containing protein [Dehalococcoidia bacterium]|nr:adenylate/guanylate cyclase domain-containing protein [Dehalococcoidia bacterium]
MAADVVGYSRLMAADEAGTHARLKALRKQFIEPTIAAHHGRTVKLMGDGALVEFASVVDAVQCAVEIQRAMAQREMDVADDLRIRFRLGVNLGDVIIEGDDIYGDGVNIAARLEGLADPGGVVISGTAFDHARNKAQAGFRFLGRQRVKNFPEPVRAYQVLLDPKAVGAVIDEEAPGAPSRWRWPAMAAASLAVIALSSGFGAWLWLWDKPASLVGLAQAKERSIAVLPFENMSGSAEQEYFSDGISEDIITDLSKISDLLVIARNSSFKFKGQSIDLRQVAGDLGVRYVLEGSVRRAGDQLRISAQLIDGGTGAHLWAERYDRPLDDVFAVQDDITRQIVQALHLEFTQAERERVMRRYTDDLQAYDDYLLARSLRADLTTERREESRRLLEGAIARDPNFAAAYAELSWVHHQAWENGRSGEASQDLALELAQKAVALDEALPEGHARLAWAHLWRRQYDDAIAEGRRAIAIDPNYADGYLLLSHILIYAGEAEEGVEIANLGMPLDPDSMYHNLMHLADGQRLLGRSEEAIEHLKRSVELRPDFVPGYVWLASTYGNLGRQVEAEAAAAQVLQLNPHFSISAYGGKVPYRDEAVLEQFRQGLRAAGLPEEPQPSVPRPPDAPGSRHRSR